MKPKLIPQDISIKKPFFWGVVFLAVTLLVLVISWVKLPPELPLFFSKPRGEQQLANVFQIVIPLGIGLLFLFINSILAQYLNQYPLLRRMLILGGTLICVAISITLLRIVLIVI